MVGHDVPFPMVSDQGGKIGRLYDVYDEEGGTNVRGRFLIDPEGIIIAKDLRGPALGKKLAEVLGETPKE